ECEALLGRLAQGNEFQLKELEILRAEIAEKDALVVRLTQESEASREAFRTNSWEELEALRGEKDGLMMRVTQADFQLQQLDVLRAELAERDALVARLTQDCQTEAKALQPADAQPSQEEGADEMEALHIEVAEKDALLARATQELSELDVLRAELAEKSALIQHLTQGEAYHGDQL
ncbi:unnamed protein product, partial [Effrenium voratum]